MSVAEQFAGLNIQSLISGPLTAAADASISLARSTADFINDVGFDVNGKIRTADFGYQRRTVNEDGTSNLEEMKVAVPMLAIVPITRYLNTLDRTKAEEDAKADAASAAMDEVNLAWTNFRNQAAELVKVLADSNPGDNKAVSELFGLVSLKSKEGTTGKYDTSESQYSALLSVQGSVVEAQKNYDSAEADLLVKKIEYNNAVSGAAPAIADNGQQNANTTPPPQNTNGGANGKR